MYEYARHIPLRRVSQCFLFISSMQTKPKPSQYQIKTLQLNTLVDIKQRKMVSLRVSLVVLLAVFCVASAHPVSHSQKLAKKVSKLNTAAKVSNSGLVQDDKKKRKVRSTVRSASRRRNDRNFKNDEVANIVVRNGKETIKATQRTRKDDDDSDDSHSDTDTDSNTDSGTGTDDDSGSETD